MATIEVVRLKRSESKIAANAFARSFFDYPLITCYFPDRSRRERYLEWYLGCMIQYGFRYGEVYTTSDIAGVAIWLPPGQTTCTTWRYILAGFLPTPFFLGIKQYIINSKGDRLFLEAHQEIMPRLHWYLWAVAVDPLWQGKGIGTSLIQLGLDKADAQNLPIYLETHDEKDVPFYQNRGFNVVRAGHVPGIDLSFWSMAREPGQKSN